MQIFARLRQLGEDPRVVVRALKRRNLEALRAAIAPRVAHHDLDVEQLVFDDAIDRRLTPTDAASVARRLFNNRLGLALAARVESKSRWRLLAASLAGLAGVLAIGSLAGGASPADKVTLVGAGLTSLLASGWLAWRALGITPESHAMLLPPGELLERADLDDARQFVQRVLLRELPADTPADLADRFRPLTVDAEGKPVDGQVIAQDLVESYALETANGRLIVLGTASLGLLLAGLGALATASAGSGLDAMLGNLLFTGSAGVVAALGVIYAVGKLFLLPEVAERRALAAHEARAASPLARLVEEGGEASFRQIEAARTRQIEVVRADQSTFVRLGTSTGLLAERRCAFAPSEAGMLVGLSSGERLLRSRKRPPMWLRRSICRGQRHLPLGFRLPRRRLCLHRRNR